MTAERSFEPAALVRDAVQEKTGVHLPSHVVNRIALLVGTQPVRFVDAPVVRDHYTLDGSVHVFTDHLLITAHLAGTLSGAGVGGQWDGAVTVTAVPRRSLLTLTTVPDAGDGMRNFNSAWVGTEVLRWPNYIELHLRYADLDHTVVLGSPTTATYGPGTSPLDAFVDSLVEDLTR